MRTKVAIQNKEQPAKSPVVIQVKTVWSESEANMMLSSGEWSLLHGGVAHADSMGYQAKPCFVMAKTK